MNARELIRRQLDSRLGDLPRNPVPKGGWIRTVRQALGMTLAQLGKRLGITAPGVAKLESGESRGAISVARLSDAADALGCDLLIAFVPRVPLTEMVRNQAIAKAQHEQSRLLHTMTLEDQSAGVGQADDIDRSVERLLNTRTSRLWD